MRPEEMVELSGLVELPLVELSGGGCSVAIKKLDHLENRSLSGAECKIIIRY